MCIASFSCSLTGLHLGSRAEFTFIRVRASIQLIPWLAMIFHNSPVYIAYIYIPAQLYYFQHLFELNSPLSSQLLSRKGAWCCSGTWQESLKNGWVSWCQENSYSSSSQWLEKAGRTSSHLLAGYSEERPIIPQPECGLSKMPQSWHRSGHYGG